MELVTWLTDDTRYAQELAQAAESANVELQIVSSITEIAPETSIVLWFATQRDDELYPLIEAHCPRVITLVQPQPHKQRLCPIRGPFSPRWYIVIPFDPEEAGIIIRGIIERGKTQASSPTE